MTDVYTQESASKKKFLAPLLVILLCMVSLTAAGYAYSATVTNEDDPIIVEGISLQLVKADGETIVTDPMYDLEFALGTHNVNGRAIYGTTGFTLADPTATDTYDGNRADFAVGYYVDTQYRIGNEGAFADVSGAAQAITPEYKLIVDNEAKSTATLNVALTVANNGGAVPDFVDKIYVVVTEVVDQGEAKVVTAYLKGTPGQGENATITLDAGLDTYTVQAYFVANDFYASQAEVGSLVLDSTCSFKIEFTATA